MDEKMERILAGIVDLHSPRAWLVINRRFEIVYANQAFCQIWNRPYEVLEGRSIADIWYNGRTHSAQGKYYGAIIATMATGQEFREAEIHLRDSETYAHYWFLANTYLVTDQAGVPEFAVANYVMIDKFKAIERQLDTINLSIIKAFARAIGSRDVYTLTHEENVAKLMSGLGEYLDLSASDISTAYLVGLVHDVGKLGIPEPVLNKPDKLTPEEYALIQRHSVIGADILKEVEGFDDISCIVRFHHERFDGAGYPNGLQGQNIPLLSRMLAVCDAYDAMTSSRCYRLPLGRENALAEVERCAGTQFDPDISRMFVQYARENAGGELCCQPV